MNLAKRHIVSKKPSKYLKQGIIHCAVYSAKGVLSAYGKDTHNDPRDYHIHWLEKCIGGIWPTRIPKVLEHHGVKASCQSAQRAENKLVILKRELAQDKPVIILIRNGYRGNGNYSALRGYLFNVGHYITLYGYDDDKEVFYVYDSCIAKKNYHEDIPIGNTTRTYQEILRDWDVRIWGVTTPCTYIVPNEKITPYFKRTSPF